MMASYLISLLVFSAFFLSIINAQYTGDPCRCDAECEGQRSCMFFSPPFDLRACKGQKDCTCTLDVEVTGEDSIGVQECSFDFDCLDGDECVDTPTFLDSNFRSCQSECGIDRENCPDSYKKPECDSETRQDKPTVTPTPSKEPDPSNTPSQSPVPVLPSLPPTPSSTPNPTLIVPMETLEGSPGIDNESPELISPSEETTEQTTTPIPGTSPGDGTGTGLTLDNCTELADCMAPRRCVKVGIPLLDCERGDEECKCAPLESPLCESDDDCVEGEQCFDTSNRGRGNPQRKICVSSCSVYETEDPEKFASRCETGSKGKPTKTPKMKPTMAPTMEATPEEEVATTPTPEPTEAICVAAEELEGVEKVFDRDFHAWVLCDSGGSCATPGHMVVWNGEGMMMKSYCDVVGCEKKIMAVNSPRYRAGGVSAKTKGLVYTNFAARWETNAEERVLAAIVRIVV